VVNIDLWHVLLDKVICFFDKGSELTSCFVRLCLIRLSQTVSKVHRSNRQALHNDAKSIYVYRCRADK